MTPKSGRSILRQETIGFAVIIALVWITELARLPHLLFDEPDVFLWPRVLFRTAVTLAVWGWVHFNTRRLLRRLHELEEFLLVCSWCRRVGDHGEWLTMEEYFGSRLATETSHGICPDCAQNHLAGHRATRVPPSPPAK